MGRYSAARDFDFSNKTIWYVVANRTDAVTYADKKDKRFHFVERHENKGGNKMEMDLVSDRPGKVSSNAGDGSIRHAFEGKLQQHERLARKFAKRLAANLESARMDDRFGSLILVAEPHFLGLLRNELTPSLQELVKHEVRHEYAQGSDDAVRTKILSAIEKGY